MYNIGELRVREGEEEMFKKRGEEIDNMEWEKPCLFMHINECRRVEEASDKYPELEVCKLCITGRIEGHLFNISKALSSR